MSVADPTAVRLADQHAHGHKKTSGRSVSGSTTVCLPNMTARADAFAPPTATFPLHDVTDCFRTRHDRPNLTVLADHCRGKRSLQIAARHPSGRQPLSRRQVPREWWSQTGSNRRPHACKARALPTELWPQSDQPEPASVTPARGRTTARSWWAWDDSNVRPHPYQGCALTT
jgi:hypothetical protein